MPLIPDGPRLAKIDPERLGLQIVNQVLHQLARFRVTLAPGVTIHTDDSNDGGKPNTRVARSVAELVRWARDGIGRHSEIPALLEWVCEVLYPRPIDSAPYRPPPLTELELDPETEIGAVLVAAAARVYLAEDKPVTARQLGVLAGVSPRWVRKEIGRGALKATGPGVAEDPRTITAREACRWLAKRGVTGFTQRRHGHDKLQRVGI